MEGDDQTSRQGIFNVIIDDITDIIDEHAEELQQLTRSWPDEMNNLVSILNTMEESITTQLDTGINSSRISGILRSLFQLDNEEADEDGEEEDLDPDLGDESSDDDDTTFALSDDTMYMVSAEADGEVNTGGATTTVTPTNIATTTVTPANIATTTVTPTTIATTTTASTLPVEVRVSTSRRRPRSGERAEGEPQAKRRRQDSSSQNPDVAEDTASVWRCPICMDSKNKIQRDGREMFSTICGHVFCNNCLLQSMASRKRCPTCRRLLNHRRVHPLYF